MTREESKAILSEIESQCCDASSIFNTLDWEQRIEALDMAIRSLTSLDKIRAEIEQIEEGISSYHNDRPWIFKDEVLQIIDKHIREERTNE